MQRNHLRIGVFSLFLFFAGQMTSGYALVITIGDVSPNDASTWTSSTDVSVGYLPENDIFNGTGSVSVTGGSDILSRYGYLGDDVGSTGEVTVDGAGSTWTCSRGLRIGNDGNGTLNITGGGVVNNSTTYGYSYVGRSAGSTGMVTVDGTGSSWKSGYTCVGLYGNGTLNITNGGTVRSYTSYDCHIGRWSGSTGVITVDGEGSTWTNSSHFYIGDEGDGALNITNRGLVRVTGVLTIDDNGDGDSFINMSDGGMLALEGEADGSLAAFLDLVSGTDAIMWWDPDIADWNLLTAAIEGEDYTLEYLTTGDLAGYTLLTVMAIEPGLGDANCDGQVDGSDATILANYWLYGIGMTNPDATWEMGDFNADHVVDGSDSTLLASHWQEGTPPPTAVPEPSTVIGLITLLLAGWALVRRNR